jgi:hypothetical protein
VPVEARLVAPATDPFAPDTPVAVEATAVADVVAPLEVSAAPLGVDLGSYVLPPNRDECSGDGATAERDECLAS